MAQCPAHDDKQQSLHVSANGKGLGLKCHAGCSNESILAVLMLSWSDLFYEAATTKDQIIAEYDYTDEKGHLLFQSLRYQPKAFRQRRPDGNGGWIWNMKKVRRVPYMLHEFLNNDDVIFIVEGEKDVHTLRVHGFTATTNAGGAGKWSPTWNEHFRMRKCIIIPDIDQPGFDHANQVAKTLGAVADVRYIRLWNAKDITEWFLSHSVEEFNLLVEGAPDFDVPIFLHEKKVEKEWNWLKGPVDYGLIGEIVQLIAPHTEADPLALYLELMATFGNCLGPGPHYRVGGTYHRCNLFVAICGETAAGRKGTAHDWVVEVFRQVDPQYVDTCILGGLASGEGVIHAVRDSRTRTLKDGSISVQDEGVSDKRRLFFESELAGRTFTAMKRDGSTLSSILRQAWESSNLAVATKTNDDKATGAHITVVGHATVLEMLSTLRLSDIVGGFANRFMFYVVRRSKLLPIQTIPNSTVMSELAARLRVTLQNARKVSQVVLGDDAVDYWVKLYTEIDNDAQNDDLSVAPFLSRAAPQILRMAMVLALVDGKSEIGVDQLTTAYDFWCCARQSVEFMLETGQDILTPDQMKLFTLLDEGNSILSCTEAREALNWGGARFAIVKDQLIKMHVISEQVERNTGGRPRKMLSTG